jgi:hypothetical protein
MTSGKIVMATLTMILIAVSGATVKGQAAEVAGGCVNSAVRNAAPVSRGGYGG